MLEVGKTQAQVAATIEISDEEAKAVAEALNLGDTGHLFREVALAGVLETAAMALRSGRGLVGDSAADVVCEIWHSYPGAGVSV